MNDKRITKDVRGKPKRQTDVAALRKDNIRLDTEQ
jgi:hypothetical protein